jgi:glutamine synthetase
MMAALDGVVNKIKPGKPLDRDIYHMTKDELTAHAATTPGSLAEALDALRKDHKFLLAGGVFTEDVIDGWIDYKMEYEVDPLRLRPHPYEFNLYYDS